MKEFTHELKEPFEYSSKGQKQKAEVITVSAPKGNQSLNLSVIEAECCKAQLNMMSAISGLAKSDTPVKEVEQDEEQTALFQVNQMLAGGGEYSKCEIAMREIFSKSALIDNEVDINKLLFGELSVIDRKVLLGKYIVNFTNTFI